MKSFIILGLSLVFSLYATPPGKAETLPAPSGAYSIGTIVADWNHIFSEKEKRRLKIQIWYPAISDSAHTAAPYFAPGETDLILPVIARFLDTKRETFASLGALKTHSGTALQPAPGGPFPVVLFNHGYWFYMQQNTALMETLASEGFIVVSIAHPGDSTPVTFSDGTIAQTKPHTPQSREDFAKSAEAMFWFGKSHDERVGAYPGYQQEEKGRRIQKSLVRWKQDVIAVLDDLETGAVPAAVAVLQAKMDFSRIAFTGMSFGGAVAASACHAEPRCKAAINLDGFQFDQTLFDTRIRMPFMILNNDWVNLPGEGRPNTPEFTATDYFYEPMAQAGNTADIHRIRVSGFRHLGFTDLPMFMDNDVLGTPDGADTVMAVNTLITTFLKKYLKGDRAAFPGATLKQYPQLIYHTAKDVRIWHESKQNAKP